MPEVPPAVDSLRRGMEGAISRGRPLGAIVKVLSNGACGSSEAAAALELAGAAWRTHAEGSDAGGILAGDALLTRALEVGCTLTDARCQRVFLEYLARAFAAGLDGGRFLLAAAVEMGLLLGDWALRSAEGRAGKGLQNLLKLADGPVLMGQGHRRANAGLQRRWEKLLGSSDVGEWR